MTREEFAAKWGGLSEELYRDLDALLFKLLLKAEIDVLMGLATTFCGFCKKGDKPSYEGDIAGWRHWKGTPNYMVCHSDIYWTRIASRTGERP